MIRPRRCLRKTRSLISLRTTRLTISREHPASLASSSDPTSTTGFTSAADALSSIAVAMRCCTLIVATSASFCSQSASRLVTFCSIHMAARTLVWRPFSTTSRGMNSARDSSRARKVVIAFRPSNNSSSPKNSWGRTVAIMNSDHPRPHTRRPQFLDTAPGMRRGCALPWPERPRGALNDVKPQPTARKSIARDSAAQRRGGS